MPRWLGIDLGGTSVKLGTCDATGRVLDRAEIPTLPRRGPRAVVADISVAARGLRGFREARRAGIGAPGPLDRGRTRVLTAPNLGWRNVPLPSLLRDALGLPVVLENDANCAALGEWVAGSGRGTDSFALYTLGTGVGGGLVIGGKLWIGSAGGAGEFGHVVIDPRGPRCACGLRGCLEVLASATAVAKAARAPDARTAFARARKGDARARAAIDRAASALGTSIAGIYQVVQPERFALAGGMALAGPGFVAKVLRAARALSFDVYRRRLQVVPAALGGDAGWIGAAFAGAR